jgi:hypothetical protein
LKDTHKLIAQAINTLEELRHDNAIETTRLDDIRMSIKIKEEDLKKREDALRDWINRAEYLDTANVRNTAMLMQKSIEIGKKEENLKKLDESIQNLFEEHHKAVLKLRAEQELFESNKIVFFNECEKKKYELQQLRGKK